MLRRSERQLRAEPPAPDEPVLPEEDPRLLSRGSLAMAEPVQREAPPDRVGPATLREARLRREEIEM
jgi:hypothetical protein